MLTKIQITGDILVETGMHIGGSTAFAAIGTVDAPVIKDSRTNLPIIPGSSLKGKMRSLLAKEMNSSVVAPDDDCEELVSILRKSTVKHQKSVVTRKISKKNMFKPLKKPKKIFVKVLKNDTPFTYTQNTNIDSKKTTASNTTLKCENNEVNMTEKANY